LGGFKLNLIPGVDIFESVLLQGGFEVDKKDGSLPLTFFLVYNRMSLFELNCSGERSFRIFSLSESSNIVVSDLFCGGTCRSGRMSLDSILSLFFLLSLMTPFPDLLSFLLGENNTHTR